MDVDAITQLQKKVASQEKEINALRKGGGKGAGKGAEKGAPKGQQEQNQQKPCGCCGVVGHFYKDCKHKDKECENCGAKGHLKKMCRKEGGGAYDPNRKPKGRGKGDKNKKGVNAVDDWPEDGEPQPEGSLGGILAVGHQSLAVTARDSCVCELCPVECQRFSIAEDDAATEND